MSECRVFTCPQCGGHVFGTVSESTVECHSDDTGKSLSMTEEEFIGGVPAKRSSPCGWRGRRDECGLNRVIRELTPDEVARVQEARAANLVTAKQPSERGPARFAPFDFPTRCRVCGKELIADDTVYYVGKQIRGAAYIRHVGCARRPTQESRETKIASADQSGRVVRKTIDDDDEGETNL